MASSTDLSAELRRQLTGTPVYGDDLRHGAAFVPWNGINRERPAARVECLTTQDVRTSLAVAAELGFPVAVAGGRCDTAGRNNRDGHLVIDLGRMRAVTFDEAAGTVTVPGGASIRSVLEALPADVVVACGSNGDVGLTGLVMGGGYGMLTSRYGLACDNVRQFEVVLADGSLVTAGPDHDKDLFWALRGGGGGFGVVTSVTLATHQLSHVLHAIVAFPIDAAREVLATVQRIVDNDPYGCNLGPLIATDAAGKARLMVVMVATGDQDTGESHLKEMEQLPGAERVSSTRMPYRETLDPDGLWPWGRFWYADTRSFERIEGPALDVVLGAITNMPPRTSLFLHDFHGAPTRVGSDESAFVLHRNHFATLLVGSYDPGDAFAAATLRAWVDETSAALAPYALPGGYTNFLRPDQVGRAREFYGPSLKRLEATKQRVDPAGTFSCATSPF